MLNLGWNELKNSRVCKFITHRIPFQNMEFQRKVYMIYQLLQVFEIDILIRIWKLGKIFMIAEVLLLSISACLKKNQSSQVCSNYPTAISNLDIDDKIRMIGKWQDHLSFHGWSDWFGTTWHFLILLVAEQENRTFRPLYIWVQQHLNSHQIRFINYMRGRGVFCMIETKSFSKIV